MVTVISVFNRPLPKGNPIYSFLMFLSGPILANIASC